jgi:acyl-CoA dehydrogenase
MLFPVSPRARDLRDRVAAFMEAHVHPAEAAYEAELDAAPTRWSVPPVMEALKAKARAEGLWNLFLPRREVPDALTNLEYAMICEVMGRSPIGAEPFNCSAPDTGNMETLLRYGTDEQKARWLEPLLAGEIRSCFAMTEPDVASSDATNIRTAIRREGDAYVIDGRKWWTSGAMDPRCRIAIVMGLTDPDGPKPPPAVDGARPHGRARRAGSCARSPSSATTTPPMGTPRCVRGRAGAGLQRAARRGPGLRDRAGTARPGRIHHCMRLIGSPSGPWRTLCRRALDRSTFGHRIADHGVTRHWIAESRMESTRPAS